MGAASCRQHSDCRHPDQVWKVNVSLQPVKHNKHTHSHTLPMWRRDAIKTKQTHMLSTLSVWQESKLFVTCSTNVHLSSLVLFSYWTPSVVLDKWWPCLVLLVKHNTLLGNWAYVIISVSKASQGRKILEWDDPSGIKASMFFVFSASMGICVLMVLVTFWLL